MEVGVQTDLLLERVDTPVYIPAKTGTDASTQIQPGEVSRSKIYVLKIAFKLFNDFSCSILKRKWSQF